MTARPKIESLSMNGITGRVGITSGCIAVEVYTPKLYVVHLFGMAKGKRAATFKLNTADRLELKARSIQATKLEARFVSMTEVLRRMIRGEPTSPSLAGKTGSSALTREDVDRWLRAMLTRGGVEVVRMGDRNGLVNVPGRYVAIIDALHVALVSIVEAWRVAGSSSARAEQETSSVEQA